MTSFYTAFSYFQQCQAWISQSPRENRRDNESQEFHTFNKPELSREVRVHLLSCKSHRLLKLTLACPLFFPLPSLRVKSYYVGWFEPCGFSCHVACFSLMFAQLPCILTSGHPFPFQGMRSHPIPTWPPLELYVRTPPAPALAWKMKLTCKGWRLHRTYRASSYLPFS